MHGGSANRCPVQLHHSIAPLIMNGMSTVTLVSGQPSLFPGSQVFNDTAGTYAVLPVDRSEGVNCSGWTNMGTCRADGCPAFAVPMNVSTRVAPVLWVLAGGADTADARTVGSKGLSATQKMI